MSSPVRVLFALQNLLLSRCSSFALSAADELGVEEFQPGSPDRDNPTCQTHTFRPHVARLAFDRPDTGAASLVGQIRKRSREVNVVLPVAPHGGNPMAGPSAYGARVGCSRTPCWKGRIVGGMKENRSYIA